MRPRVRESGVCGTGSSARRSARYESINVFNPLELRGNYTLSATSNYIQLVHWPSIGGLLHLVQQWGEWAEPQPAQAPPRCTKCNTAHPSTASVPITVMLRCSAVLRCPLNGQEQKSLKDAYIAASDIKQGVDTISPRSPPGAAT